MSVNSELYDALSAIVPDGRVFDAKLPDEDALDTTALVFSLVSDVPEVPIDGAILGYEQRWQVSIYDVDLERARAIKNAVIAALHGMASGTVQWCEFDSAPGEIYESDAIPPCYHIPLDFVIAV